MTRQPLLDNVYLTYVPSEKFKTSLLSAQMAVPLTSETAGRNALLVNVLSRGTVRCPDMEALSRALDLLYGAQLEPTVRKKGENQLFGFMTSFVDDRYLPAGTRLLEPAADLLGDLFCSPATRNGRLDWDYVASERENLADLIRGIRNDRRAYAGERLIEEMCAGEAYGVGRVGRAADVEKITARRLNRHYQWVLPRGQLELFYCGSAGEERVRGALLRAFAALPRQGTLAPAATVRRPAPDAVRTVEEEMDVDQGKLCVGFRAESGDVPANMVVNAMFGGGLNAKLFLQLREKLSLCYYIDSAYHRAKGLVTVSAGIEAEDRDRAVDEIMAQLDAVARGAWEDWELESAKNYLISSLRGAEDSAAALEDFAMAQAAAGGGETLPDLRRAVEAVSGERIMAAAAAVKPDTVYFLRGREARP